MPEVKLYQSLEKLVGEELETLLIIIEFVKISNKHISDDEKFLEFLNLGLNEDVIIDLIFDFFSNLMSAKKIGNKKLTDSEILELIKALGLIAKYKINLFEKTHNYVRKRDKRNKDT